MRRLPALTSLAALLAGAVFLATQPAPAPPAPDVPTRLVRDEKPARGPELIRDFGEIDNIHSCAAYLQTMKEIGFEIDLFYLMAKAEKVLAGKEREDEKFGEQLKRLLEFYQAGYARYREAH